TIFYAGSACSFKRSRFWFGRNGAVHSTAARTKSLTEIMDRLILTPGLRRQTILELLQSARNQVAFSLFRCDDSRVLDEIVATSRRGVNVRVLVTPKARGWNKRLG